jgi:TRAP-type mannitol/chloroaromatic compound transport system permease small subunit
LKAKNKGVTEKSKKFPISILLYIAASLAAIMGIVLLVDNVYIFNSTVNQYVAQGYAASDVMKSLIPSQLIPGIIEAFAIYGGIALILLGVGIVNKKISEFSIPLAESQNNENSTEEIVKETEEIVKETEEIRD